MSALSMSAFSFSAAMSGALLKRRIIALLSGKGKKMSTFGENARAHLGESEGDLAHLQWPLWADSVEKGGSRIREGGDSGGC
jgi:hypothetical protein